jgi:hypothetical protein
MTSDGPSDHHPKLSAGAQKLLDRSHLTNTQVETIITWQNKRESGQTIQNSHGTVELPSKTVSPGSFYRSLSQGRENIRKSINTLILGAVFGLLHDATLYNLTRLLTALRTAEIAQIDRILAEINRSELI